MTLTAEQQAQIDIQLAVENVRHANHMAMEEARNTAQAAMQAKQAKLEAIRLAKETLIENSRNKPVESREISVLDIKNFADQLISYVGV